MVKKGRIQFAPTRTFKRCYWYIEEIRSMLDEYAADKGVEMDTQEIADRLFYYTSGYPFLVSSLCKNSKRK